MPFKQCINESTKYADNITYTITADTQVEDSKIANKFYNVKHGDKVRLIDDNGEIATVELSSGEIVNIESNFVNESAKSLHDNIVDFAYKTLPGLSTKFKGSLPTELAVNSVYTESYAVEPKDLGMYGAFVTKATIYITVNTFAVGEAVITFKLSYTHTSGGSNGIDVQYLTVDDGKTWKLR